MQHSNTEVRQSAYALLGDLAPGCFSALRPHVGEWMPLVKEEIKNHQHTSTCNNAVWSLGSVVVMLGGCSHWVWSLDLVVGMLGGCTGHCFV